MLNDKIINKKLFEQVLKEQMIVDSIIILSTVEFIQRRIEEKLLEIDMVSDNHIFEDTAVIRIEILELLSKLRREEQRMNEFMIKYQGALHEKKAMLSNSRKRKPIYLRGISTYTRGKNDGSKV